MSTAGKIKITKMMVHHL